jgi:hypothetical protein
VLTLFSKLFIFLAPKNSFQAGIWETQQIQKSTPPTSVLVCTVYIFEPDMINLGLKDYHADMPEYGSCLKKTTWCKTAFHQFSENVQFLKIPKNFMIFRYIYTFIAYKISTLQFCEIFLSALYGQYKIIPVFQ